MSGELIVCSPSLLFRVAAERYLIDLEAVTEVAPAARPCLIPCIPLDLAGVINVRGEPVPVVDGGAVLQGRHAPSSRHALLLDAEGHRVGVLVAEVSRIERRQPTLPEGRQEDVPGFPFIQRAHLADGEVGVVDVSGLLARALELLGGGAQTTGGKHDQAGADR
jgi:chemotaxis signal transduction protein